MQSVPTPGATSAFVSQLGPPAPSIDGYAVTLDASSASLSLARVSGSLPTPLASFNISTLDNGLVIGAWNMLRVLVQTTDEGSVVIQVCST